MSRRAKILSILGVQPQCGSSTFSLLVGRHLAAHPSSRCALIDSRLTGFPQFPFASPTASPRSFQQLLPYAEQLQDETIENFFAASEEGLRYIPLGEPAGPDLLSRLLKTLRPFFDFLIVDQTFNGKESAFLTRESGEKSLIISSLENKSVLALKKLEKSMLESHLPLRDYKVFFNQTNSSQPLLKDFSSWSSALTFGETLSFQGDDFANAIRTKKIQTLSKNTDISRLIKSVEGLLSDAAEPPSPSPDPARLTLQTHQIYQLHQKLLEALRSGGQMDASQSNSVLKRELLEPKAREILNRLIQDFDISDREQTSKLIAETLDLCFGLGPLEPLLQNEAITEIMVNGPKQVFIEKKGLLEKTEIEFHDDQQLRTILERVLAPLGRRIDESQPTVDGRLPDGSRINAVLPPLSLNGPLLTIRKFSKRKLTVEDLIKLDSLTQEAADFLGACVRAKKNIVVSGGTGSGKTTLLNILSAFIPAAERIVTIEDSAELQLSQPHVVRLEGRPANLEGKGQVTIRDLVINALRMRPDRIIVGEVRAGEALDMLQAMNTGHDGSLTTGHANSPRDMLARLETMCLFTGLNLPIQAIREQIARAIQLVVQQSRLPNGKRAVVKISEIQGMEADVILLQDLFALEEEKGLTRKSFAPKFIQDLEAVGYRWPGHQAR